MNFNHHGHTSQYLTVLFSVVRIKCNSPLKCSLIRKVVFNSCEGGKSTCGPSCSVSNPTNVIICFMAIYQSSNTSQTITSSGNSVKR